MKIKSLLLLSLLSPLPLIAQTYMAEGINQDDITKSTLFFDSGKGEFWNTPGGQPLLGIQAAFDGKITVGQIMGDLNEDVYSFLQGNTYYSDGVTSLLRFDVDSCWYQAGANVIEYWQHSYGVFATKSVSSGYTYDEKYLTAFAGTQSLDLGYDFYHTFQNANASNFGKLADWYFNGETGGSNALVFQSDADQTAGYFSEYFSRQSTYQTNEFNYTSDYRTESLADVTERLVEAMGYEIVDGAPQKVTEGQIATISVGKDPYSKGHVITCYGFELDEKNELKSIIIADSDDLKYGTTTLYIQQSTTDPQRFELFTNPECTEKWVWAGSTEYALNSIHNINTPDSLKQLEASYNKADNAQVWSGGLSEWGGTDDTDDGGIATYQSGWVRYASNQVDSSFDGYFHSKADDTRATVFNDYIEEGTPTVTERSITLATSITTPSVLIDNTNIAYSFIGEGKYLTADTLTKTGSNSASFSDTKLTVREVTVDEGSLKLSDSDVTGGATVNGGTLELSGSDVTGEATVNGGTLELSGSSISGQVSVQSTGEILITGAENSLNSGLTLAAGSDIKFSTTGAKVTITGELVIDKNFQSENSIIGTIVLKGNLTVKDVAQQTSLSYANLLSIDATSTEIATLNANLDLTEASSLTMNGALSIGGDLLLSSTNKLTLNFDGMPQLDENNYLALFSDIQNLRIDGMIAGADTNYFDYMELSPEVQASLGADASLKYDATAGQFYVDTKGVPEPSSGALALLGLTGLLARRRRKG